MYWLAIDTSALGPRLRTEASRAVLEHALRVLGIDPVIALVEPRNFASTRVAEKIGMRRVGINYHYGKEQILFWASMADLT